MVVQLVTRGVLVNETFIGGSGTNEYAVRRDVCCFLWPSNSINSLCHGLVGLAFLSCILESNKCPCVKAVESQ